MLDNWKISARGRQGHVHLTSKDGFWMLGLQLLLKSQTPSGAESYSYRVKIYQPDSKFEWPGPTIAGSSEMEAIREASVWASMIAPRLERIIFLSDKKAAKSARAKIRYEILHGSEDAHALQFVKHFVNKLIERRSEADTDKEEEAALADIDLFLSKDNIYRFALPPDLEVHADWLESIGVIPSENPKSKGGMRRSSPSSLIDRCQNLWTQYYNKPTKKNLKAVFAHLDKMKSSKSEKVKKERARCLRAANKEAKRLKLK